ncbi:MAG: hypothetical protein JSS76_19725 [Bacteroidetes bacterium]|nr:hypothetical protein [Bacteroidota bacterium]
MGSENNPTKSSRRYPERICANPDCVFGKIFTPHDKRQKYCSRACGSHYRNDKRSEQLHTKYAENKILNKNEEILESLMRNNEDPQECMVHLTLLNLLGFNSDYSIAREKYRDGRIIHWMYEYGLVIHKSDPKWFAVLKRK